MSIFTKLKSTGGIMDVIRCDEPSYLIWKWHPKGTQSGKNNRENAIRIGSSLRVREGEVAVFVYKQNHNTLQDFIVGPFEQIIKTANFPVLSNIIGLAYDGGTPFPAEVYFINLAHVIQIKFGVPFFDIFDPRFSDFSVPVAVRGTITFRITDYREFIKLHRLDNFDLIAFQNEIRDAVVRYVKTTTANIPSRYSLSALQIERKLPEANEEIEAALKVRLKEDFGVTVSGLDISDIEIDRDSEGYRQLKAVTQDSTVSVLQAQTAVNIKEMQDKQRIEAENYAETLRIQREEAQYAQHKQTQTANLTALHIEKQSEVGIAGANALGQMASNNAGNISESGFNPAAIIAGMSLGGTVAQTLSQTVSTAMNAGTPAHQTPPPLSSIAYYVAVNGQATGAFSYTILKEMVSTGNLTPDSLVWKEGMSEWKKAGTIPELKDIFPSFPAVPPIPTI